MLLVTTERIAGREIEPLGIVEGSSVQTVHAGKDIMNSLKNVSGWRAYFIHGDDGESQNACNR
mgnify:CR=1 FL=1